MIKRTLYFGNPVYLGLKLEQLEIQFPNMPNEIKKFGKTTVPMADIGVILLDHAQITITQPCLNALLNQNVAVITCGSNHMPVGLFMPLEVHHTQQERFEAQINASIPLKKQLWAQVIVAKINNQGRVIEQQGIHAKPLYQLAKNVKSGDADNNEAQAAAYYWKHIFKKKWGCKKVPLCESGRAYGPIHCSIMAMPYCEL